jgi:hypothetical protein
MDVKTLCLCVLTEGDKSGYEIKRCFEEAFSHFFSTGFGSAYSRSDAGAPVARRPGIRLVGRPAGATPRYAIGR